MHIVQRLCIAVALCLATACSAKYSAVSVAEVLNQLQKSEAVPQGEINRSQGTSHGIYFDGLVRLARSLNLKTVMTPKIFDDDGWIYDGFYDKPNHRILIRSGMSPNTNVLVMAHELGHVLQPMAYDDHNGQVFAEAVSHIYSRRIGMKDWRYSFAYMNNYSQAVPILRKYQKEIDLAVDKLLAAQ